MKKKNEKKSQKKELINEEKIKEYLKEESDWFVAFIVGAIIFTIIIYYHYIRRGIINPFLPNEVNFLLLTNKAFAISSIFLIGISFLIGPLAKFSDYFKNKIRYRREIGVMGFLFALVHIIILIFFLESKFPREWFAENQLSVIFGVVSLVILIIVTSTSNNFSIKKLGYKKWISVQRLAYLALILAVVHFIILKFSGWKEWMNTLNPIYPPGTLIALIFIVAVLLIRIIVLFIDKKEGKVLNTT